MLQQGQKAPDVATNALVCCSLVGGGAYSPFHGMLPSSFCLVCMRAFPEGPGDGLGNSEFSSLGVRKSTW